MEELITITTWILCCDKCDSQFEVTAAASKKSYPLHSKSHVLIVATKPGLGGRETHTIVKLKGSE
jgi:hypothetical protein